MYDLSSFCFICFNTNKTLDAISSNDTEFLTNLKEIGYETDWLVKETPIQICSGCIYILNITTNFKELCGKNNATLKSYIDKLKNGAVCNRVEMQVLAKHNRRVFSKKSNGRFTKVQVVAKRQRKVKKTPNIGLNLECSVKLDRISVPDEQKKLLNASRLTFADENKDGGIITGESQNKDDDLMRCDSEIIDDGSINDDITSSDFQIEDRIQVQLNKSPIRPTGQSSIALSVDELFPAPQDSRLKYILKSLEHSAANADNSNKEQLNEMYKSMPTVAPDAGREFITKLKEGFRNTLISYSNIQMGELRSDTSIANHLRAPERTTPNYSGFRPVPLAKLLATPLTNLNNNQGFVNNSTSSMDKNLKKRKALPNATAKPKHSKILQNTASFTTNQNLLTSWSSHQQYGSKVLTNQNLGSPYLHSALTQIQSNDIYASKTTNNNIEILSSTSDYVNAADSDIEIISDVSNNPDFGNESINPLMDSDCEVIMDDTTECERLDNCVLCNSVNENPNSNYCVPCFKRLNLNSQQKDNGTCINCNQPFEYNNASLFCANCNKITVTKSLRNNKTTNTESTNVAAKPIQPVPNLPINTFGIRFSHCVLCCKISDNVSGVATPNILCTKCEVHAKLADLQLINCDLCPLKFANEVKFHAHIKEHAEKPCKCPICLKQYASNRNLQKHYKQHTQTSITANCIVCGKQFFDEMLFKEHRQMHRIAKTIQCGICGKNLIKRSFKRHLRMVHPLVPESNAI